MKTSAAMMTIAALAIVPLLRGQSNIPLPKWEAVSIKPCTPGGRGGVGRPDPGRITVNCVSLMTLIRQSYILFANGKTMNLQQTKLVPMDKGPAWIDSDLYTIEAKAETTVPSRAGPGQAMMLGPMMQAVLEDRFKLKLHRETRQVPVYTLAVTKDGPKLQPAARGNCVVQDLDQPFTPPPPGQAPLPFCGMAHIMTNGFDMKGATMAELSTALSGWVDRKVVDKTGIAGAFDVRVDGSNGELPSAFAPPQPGVPPPPSPDPAETTASIQSALQKLGLKLEPAQGPEGVLIIDHVERPSEN